MIQNLYNETKILVLCKRIASFLNQIFTGKKFIYFKKNNYEEIEKKVFVAFSDVLSKNNEFCSFLIFIAVQITWWKVSQEKVSILSFVMLPFRFHFHAQTFLHLKSNREKWYQASSMTELSPRQRWKSTVAYLAFFSRWTSTCRSRNCLHMW